MSNELRSFTFESGSHSTREQGLCVMEAAAMLAGERHTDRPECADDLITNLSIFINDKASHELRQELCQDLPWRVIGTYTDDAKLLAKREAIYNREMPKIRAKYHIKTYSNMDFDACILPGDGHKYAIPGSPFPFGETMRYEAICNKPHYVFIGEPSSRMIHNNMCGYFSSYYIGQNEYPAFLGDLKALVNELIEVTEIREVVPTFPNKEKSCLQTAK